MSELDFLKFFCWGEGGRTRAVGAGHLKAFLEYAERGNAIVSAASVNASNENFSNVVAAFLKEKGYEVDRNVGCSECRIDVAVRNPDDPNRYLMGVECDGPTYADLRYSCMSIFTSLRHVRRLHR